MFIYILLSIEIAFDHPEIKQYWPLNESNRKQTCQ